MLGVGAAHFPTRSEKLPIKWGAWSGGNVAQARQLASIGLAILEKSSSLRLTSSMRISINPLLTTCFAVFGMSLPAQADFRVCNQSFDVINVAIGLKDPAGPFKTEGWWTVGTNQCARVIRGELRTRYIYVHASDVFGQPVVESDLSMCIDPVRFEILGETDCWQRGHRAAPFIEVDTQAVERWTLILSPQDETAEE